MTDCFEHEEACEVCGQPTDTCICPACSVCGDHGNPMCYVKHWQYLSDAQIESRLGHLRAVKEAAAIDAEDLEKRFQD